MIFILQGCMLDKCSGQKSPEQREPVPLLTKCADRHPGELSPNSYINLFLKIWDTSLMITGHNAPSFHIVTALGWPGGMLSGGGPAKRKALYTHNSDSSTWILLLD